MKRQREMIVLGVIGLLLIGLSFSSFAQENPPSNPFENQSFLTAHEFSLGDIVVFDFDILLNSTNSNAPMPNASMLWIFFENNNGTASFNESVHNGTLIESFTPQHSGTYHIFLDINASINGSLGPTSHNKSQVAEAIDTFFVAKNPAALLPSISTNKDAYSLGETVIIGLNHTKPDHKLYLSSKDAVYELIGTAYELNYTPISEGYYTLSLKHNETVLISTSFTVSSIQTNASTLIVLNATRIDVKSPLLIIPLEMVSLIIEGAGSEFRYDNLTFPYIFTPELVGTYTVTALSAHSTQQLSFTAVDSSEETFLTYYLNEPAVLDVDLSQLAKSKRTLFNVIFRTSPLDSVTFFVQRHANDFRFNLSAERISEYHFRIIISPHSDITEQTYVLESLATFNGKEESHLTPFAWIPPPFSSQAPPPQTQMDIIKKYTPYVFPIEESAVFDIDITSNVSAQRNVLELALKQPKVESFTVFVKGHQNDQRFQLSLVHREFDRFEVTIPHNPSIPQGVYTLIVDAGHGGLAIHDEIIFSWGIFDAATFLHLFSIEQSLPTMPLSAIGRMPAISSELIDFGDFNIAQTVRNDKNFPIDHTVTHFNVKEENLSSITADMTLSFSGKGISSAQFIGTKMQKNSSFNLGFADLPKSTSGPRGLRIEKAYAIDPTAMEFSNATITSIAQGKELYKCKEWNFTTQSCQGTWEKLMDIVPGEEYLFFLTPEDPGYAEVGLATINTNKSLYRLMEHALITMVVLDNQGFLVQGAQVELNVTSPLGASAFLSTQNTTINEASIGIYEAHFSNISEEGNYTLTVHALGNNVNNTLTSYFTVKQNYAFDILRDTPATTDPFKGPFLSSLRIVSLDGATIFNVTEVLPSSFAIYDAGGAQAVFTSNKTTLIWAGLSNNSVVFYTARPPLITPELWEIGPATITYGAESFTEARPWLFAVDPDAFPSGTTQLKPQSCSAQTSQTSFTSFDAACDGTYPSTCTGTDLLSCDDANIETHTGGRAGAPPTPRYGGVQVTYYNSSIDDCFSITSVRLCYKMWSADTGYTCNVSVNNDGDNSFAQATTFGCGSSEPATPTCVDISSTEDWACSNFFGSSVNRAQAVAQAYDDGGGANSDAISIDALFFNVTYALDTTPPRLNTSINNTSPYFGDVVNLTANASDTVALSFCQFIHNQSGPLGIAYLNRSVSGSNIQCSQNFTIYVAPYSVINFTVLVNDTKNNKNQSSHIITIANGPPAISLSLNRSQGVVYFGDTINISGITTDDLSLSTGQVIVNDTGTVRFFNFSLTGTSAQFSQNITLSCPVGCVINFTVWANDSITLFSQDTVMGVVSELPPNLSAPECSINGGGFESCRNLGYFESLDTIRSRCNSTSGSMVNNVTFIFSNLEDNRVYFNQTVTTTTDTYWQYSTGGINISDSGSFSIYTLCRENVIFTNHTNWTIPWGSLVSTLILPTHAVNVTKGIFFNFTAQVQCVGGECGSINATLDPQSSNGLSNDAQPTHLDTSMETPIGAPIFESLSDLQSQQDRQSQSGRTWQLPSLLTLFNPYSLRFGSGSLDGTNRTLPEDFGKINAQTSTEKSPTENVAGILIANPSKSTYDPFTFATLHAIVLDSSGKPHKEAFLTGYITTPSNSTIVLSPFSFSYPRYSTSHFLTEEGRYIATIKTILEGREMVSRTSFLSSSDPSFLIKRDQQDVLDPWKEPFSSRILIQPKDIRPKEPLTYSAFESLPEEFSIIHSSATTIKREDSRLILAWENLTGESVLEYSAALPQRTPIVYAINPLEISFDKGALSFFEPTSFLIASDPAGSVNITSPDAAAPGMSVAVQFVGDDFDSTDSITLNTTDIFVGQKRITNTSGNPVTNNGRVMTVPFFISPDAQDQVVGIRISGTLIAQPFRIITPQSGSGNFAGATGVVQIGDGKNGTRTFGGTIVLDSLIIPTGVTVFVNTSDPDGDPSNGHQGYLPATIIVDGPVNISGILNVSGESGGVGLGEVGGVGGIGGPGGAGGGAGGGDRGAQNNGGNGFTGGGGGSCEGDDPSCVEGNGGAGSGAAGTFGSTTTDTGGAGGRSLSPFVTGGGQSTGSTGSGANGDGSGGGGGTGFYFGSSGSGGNDATATEGIGGAGGGGGSINADGGGAGFGTAGTAASGGGGSANGNSQLIPLSGGSGGGGAGASTDNGGGGGGGGGSVFIFSTSTLNVSGSILSQGGDGGAGTQGAGGAGSGGSIILQSSSIGITGILDTSGGTSGGGGNGGLGRVRVDGMGISTIPTTAGSVFNGSVITDVSLTHVSGRGAPSSVLELIVQTSTTNSTFNGTVEQDGTFAVPVAYSTLGMTYISLLQNTSAGIVSVVSSASLATIDVNKGVIPMYSGFPFFTTSLNPADFNNNSCLFNMTAGSVCQTSWMVNATGTPGSTWEFFVIHSAINYSSYVIENTTSRINITILENLAPSVSQVSLLPYLIAANYSTLNCSFVVSDPNSLDDLSAEVRWYRNDVLNVTQIVGATNNQIANATLTSNYTQVGDFWTCGVIPLDEVTSGSQSNSSETEIYRNFPPSINSVQCQINNTAWGSCNQLSFSDILTSVRVNCTSIISLNTTVNFTNYDDQKTFFHNTSVFQSGDYIILNNSDVQINDSGNFLINATCTDGDGISRHSNVTWAVPYGTLSASLVEPASNTNVEKDQVFTFTTIVSCRGGECGTLNSSVIYNTSSTTWAYVNTTVGDMPFFTRDMNPKTYLNQSCLSNLTAPNTCTAIWNINASGPIFSSWRVFTEFNATTYLLNVSGSQTSTIVLTIVNSNLVPPIVTLNAPSDLTLTNSPTILFNCSATDNLGLVNLSLYSNFSGTFSFNGSSIVTGTVNSSNFTRTLPDGTYGWNCRAYDTNDNDDWGNFNRTINIDTARPRINLTNPPNASNLFSGTVQFDFNASDNFDHTLSCNLTLDGSLAQLGISAANGANTTATINGLTQGAHYWNVTCVDDADNSNTSETRQFSIIDIPPVANLTTANNSLFNSGNITLSYNATDNNDVVRADLWINGALNQTSFSVTDGEINVFTIQNMSEGDHNWTVNVTDISDLDFMAEWRYFRVDLSPGSITLNGPPNATTINVSSSEFNFTLLDRFSSSFTCNLTMNESIMDSNFNANNGSITTRTLSNLADGWKIWNVTCKDHVNNTNTSLSYFINISVPPTVSQSAPTDGFVTQSQNLNFTYTPTDNSNFSKCEFIVNGEINFTNSTVFNNVPNNFSLQNIAPGRYNWTVNCTDVIGLTANAPVRNFTVDIQRPNVTLYDPLASEIIGNSNVLFNFSATDDIDTSLYCNLSINNLVNVSGIAAQNGSYTNVTVRITDEATYTWNITCIDDAGNSNASETRQFSTVLPPEVYLLTPGDGNIFDNGTLINLTFIVFDNQGLNNASLMVNGRLNQTLFSPPTDETLYFLINITEDGVYFWNVNVSDTNELYGSDALNRNFTVDTTGPLIINYTPQSLVTLASNNVSFNFSVSDALDALIECNLSIDGTVQYSANITNGSSLYQTHLLADGAHTWFATCIDHANNTNVTPVTSFTVEAPPNVTLISVANNTRTYIPNTTFTYLPQDPLGIYNCTLFINSIENETNTAPTVNAQNSFLYNSTGHGQYNWTVLCHDAAPDYNPYSPPNFTWFVDLLGPSITPNAPTEGQNFNDDDITFNFTPTDQFGFAVELLCNLTLDGIVNITNISIMSGEDNITTIANLSTGQHSYNITCTDDFNNTNTSPTVTFIVNSPDLALNATDITFNNTNPYVNDSILVNATFYNIGGIPATNFYVLFYDNEVLFENKSIVSLPQAQNMSVNATFNATLGFHSILVDISYEPVELRKDNNNATSNLSTLLSYFIAPTNGTFTNNVSTVVNFTLQDFAQSSLNYTFYLDGRFNRTGMVLDNQSLGAEFNLSEGIHALIAEALGPRVDVLGKNGNLTRKRNSTALTLIVDFTAPLPQFETRNGTWFSDVTPEIRFNITDNLDIVLNYSLYINYVLNQTNYTANGTSTALNLSTLANGAYNLTLESYDDSGNRRNSSNITIFIDTVVPIPTITTVNGSNFSDQTPPISFTITDAQSPTINYTFYVTDVLDRAGNAFNGNPSSDNLFTHGDGQYKVLLEAMDLAGNKANSTFINITIDTTAPTIVIDYPLENQPVGYLISLLTSVTDGLVGISHVRYSIYNDSSSSTLVYYKNGTLNASTTFDDLWNSSVGISEDVEFMTVNFSVTANDTLGNTRTEVRRFIVDNRRPTISFFTPNGQDFNRNFSLDIRVQNRNLTISRYNITNLTGDLITNRSNNSISSAQFNWSTIINLSNDPLFLEGVYNITVFALDEVGNNRTSTSFFRIDRTYPNTTSVYPPNYFNTTSATLSLNFTVLDNFDGYPLCNLSLDGIVAVSTINATNGSITNITVANLAEGFHYWNVTCEDNAGNYNTSHTRNFTIDQSAPTILLEAPANNSFNASLSMAFFYTPSENYTTLQNCTLIIDGQANQTNHTVVNGALNNFTLHGLDQKRYEWAVNCTDSALNVGSNASRFVFIDFTPPNATFVTNNGTWFNTAMPTFFFNITDNLDIILNYTVYADGILHAVFHIENATLTSTALNSLQNGTHLVVIESYDDAYNRINSTNLTIIIDTVQPNVTLLMPLNGTNTSLQNLTFSFNVTDNLDSELLCNLSVDGMVNISLIPALNGLNISRNVTGLSYGYHNWSVACMDNATNVGYSEHWYFNITPPDLEISFADITFNMSGFEENLNFTIFVNVTNIGIGPIVNALVQLYDDDPDNGGTQIGPDFFLNLESGQNKTIGLSWSFGIGTTTIFALLDSQNELIEIDETNNKANRSINISAYNVVFGNITGSLVIQSVGNQTVYSWQVSNSTQGNIFVIDSDSSIVWSNITALGVNVTGGNVSTQTSDFADLDLALGMTNLSDSINRTYIDNNRPKNIQDFTIFAYVINTTPIVNSTNSSNFVTGILWDKGDLNSGEFNGTQDVIFATEIRRNTLSQYGVYDFELKVPARLREYRQPNFQNSVTFYAELK